MQLHKEITTTMFWVGEEADESNLYIHNRSSAWDEDWEAHFGGVDDPRSRKGWHPASFKPKENPFYCALPFNDFDDDGNRKPGLAAVQCSVMSTGLSTIIPWYSAKKWAPNESMCKNQWIEIINQQNRKCYAQWEDVGPNGEDDVAYVFGNVKPSSKFNDHAGLDVSPAVRDYLGLDRGKHFDKCHWRFVAFHEVPDGPWKEIITTRNAI